MKVKALLLSLIVCFGFAPLMAQVENLQDDEVFFLQKKDDYQRWMDETGLGRYLRVEDLRVEPERVRLYLGFYASSADTILSIWSGLKAAHDVAGGLKLEESLLFRMCHLMGLRQQAAVIEVYDTYDLSLEPLFFRGIYFDEGRVQVKENNPRGAQVRLFEIKASDIKVRRDAKTDFSKQYTRDYVYDKILKFAREKYARSPCELRYPAVRHIPHDEYLRFEVTDLCREVIKEAENPTVCRWLRAIGYSCNWTTREKLVFTFVYSETTGGFTLHLTLEGSVGSGFYSEVKRNGYMDMEFDFKRELEEYADAIVQEIKQYLRR
ncbi:MAG: hypothetical protein ACK4NS_13320 [Saprospiraceae bacterium]